MPSRVQRRRVKGWWMPEGTVYVGRGSRFAVRGSETPTWCPGLNPQTCITTLSRHAMWTPRKLPSRGFGSIWNRTKG